MIYIEYQVRQIKSIEPIFRGISYALSNLSFSRTDVCSLPTQGGIHLQVQENCCNLKAQDQRKTYFVTNGFIKFMLSRWLASFNLLTYLIRVSLAAFSVSGSVDGTLQNVNAEIQLSYKPM